MKLKLGKIKKKNNTKENKQEISNQNTQNSKSIQQLIFDDVKNINKFNIIMEEFLLILDNKDIKKIKELHKIIYEIFEYFLVKNKNIITEDLSNFIYEKIITLNNIYLDLASDSINSDEDPSQEKFFNLILHYLFNNFKFFSKKEDQNNKEISNIFDKLIQILILNEDLVEPNYIKNFVKNLGKKLEMFLNSLYGSVLNLKEFSDELFYNFYNFLIALPKIENSEESILIKKHYQNLFTFLINSSNLPKEILKNLLLNLNKIIFDNLENPLIFSDYLINIYEKSDSSDFETKILSLSGLFVLITKYKLDYANYYVILYRTVCMFNIKENEIKTIFDSKYSTRFFKILELSLKSSSVPIIVTLSFIKKLARICLISSPNIIALLLGIIQNIIKMHPKAIILLIRRRKREVSKNEKIKESSSFLWEKYNSNSEKKEKEKESLRQQDDIEEINMQIDDFESESQCKYEQFDDKELNPNKTNARYSCLWELYTLKNHYSFKVRSIVHKFEKNFLKSKEFDLNSVSNLKEDDIKYEITDKSNFYINYSTTEEDLNTLSNKINKI